MMLLRAHARDGNSKAYSDRSANWQVAVRLRGRRNAVLRVENAAVDLKIRPRTGSKSQAFTSASLMMLLRAHARDGNSKAYSDRSANWQVAVRLRGRRNAVLRVENAAVDLMIRLRTGSNSQISRRSHSWCWSRNPRVMWENSNACTNRSANRQAYAVDVSQYSAQLPTQWYVVTLGHCRWYSRRCSRCWVRSGQELGSAVGAAGCGRCRS